MRKKICSISFMFLLIFVLCAQTANEADALFSKGNEFFDTGDYDTALTYYQKAVPAHEKTYGAQHIYTGDLYFFIGLSYSKKKDYETALRYLQKSLVIYETQKSDRAADAEHEIGSIYFHQLDYESALLHHQKSLEIRLQRTGENHKNTAIAYFNVGMMYHYKGNYDKALTYFEKSLAIRQKISGENSLETAMSYRQVGLQHYCLGNYNEAMNYLTKAVKIKTLVAGTDSAEIAQSYGDLATVQIELGQYANALDSNGTAEAIYAALEYDDPEVFAVLYNERGRCYRALGNYTQALLYYNKALDIGLKIYGEKHLDIAKVYLNIGDIYQRIGDYTRALANLEHALKILGKIYDKQHPDMAICCRTIGTVYKSMGNFDAALEYLQKAAGIFRKLFGEKYIELAYCYSEIGFVYEVKEDYERALEYYRKSMDLIYEVYGYATVESANAYSNIARVYSIMGDYQNALNLDNAALEIYKRFLGDEHLTTANQYMSLGWYYAAVQKNAEKGIPYLRKSLAGLKKSTGYAQVIRSLQLTLAGAELFGYNNNAAFIRDVIALATDTVERARLDLSSIRTDILRKSLPVYYYGIDFEAKQNNAAKAFEYSEALRSRGFLDQIGTDRALTLAGVTDAERKQAADFVARIATARHEIEVQNDLTLEVRDTKKLIQAEKALATAEKELLKLDTAIGKRIPAYTQLRNPQPVTVNAARKWCGKDRAVLEYVMWNPKLLSGTDMTPPNGGTLSLHSYCLIVTNKTVTAIPLDDGYDYAAAIARLRDGIIPKRIKPAPETTFEDVRNERYTKLVEPVLPYIKGKKRLLIVPDGSLAFLPFDVLRKSENTKMVCDEYAVAFSPSVSVSMIAETSRTQESKMLAFGGAWYDTELSAEEHRRTFDTQDTIRGKKRGLQPISVELHAENAVQEAAMRQDMQDNGPSHYFRQKNLHWKDLPGTILELNTLKTKTIGTKKYTQYIQEDASEQIVKRLSEQNSLAQYPILHFACHGYFDKNFADMSSILFSEVSGKLTGISSEDGYLTIPEVSVLNLGADMVCLSACETGLGEVKSGDGMVGLSRAFMVAGARHVGVTLWSVDDMATATFMANMYKKIEKKGMTYEQAYRQTKAELQKSEDYSHPYYWAAFTLYE